MNLFRLSSVFADSYCSRLMDCWRLDRRFLKVACSRSPLMLSGMYVGDFWLDGIIRFYSDFSAVTDVSLLRFDRRMLFMNLRNALSVSALQKSLLN